MAALLYLFCVQALKKLPANAIFQKFPYMSIYYALQNLCNLISKAGLAQEVLFVIIFQFRPKGSGNKTPLGFKTFTRIFNPFSEWNMNNFATLHSLTIRSSVIKVFLKEEHRTIPVLNRYPHLPHTSTTSRFNQLNSRAFYKNSKNIIFFFLDIFSINLTIWSINFRYT